MRSSAGFALLRGSIWASAKTGTRSATCGRAQCHGAALSARCRRALTAALPAAEPPGRAAWLSARRQCGTRHQVRRSHLDH